MTEWLSSGGRFRSAMPLRRFNRLPTGDAVLLLRQCLSVDRWVQTVAAARPYRRLDDLLEVSRDAAFPFTAAELEAALSTIVPPPLVPAAREFESRYETQLREQLAAGVAHYQRRFGRPFLIRRDGRSDAQILVQLWKRLGHDIDAEDRVIAQQVREDALTTVLRTISE